MLWISYMDAERSCFLFVFCLVDMGNAISSEKHAQQACSRMSQHELNQALADVVNRNEQSWRFRNRRAKTATSPPHEGLVSDAKLLKLLLANGANPRAVIRDDNSIPHMTPFRLAVNQFHGQCVRAMLRHDRSLANCQWANDGNTPLHEARTHWP